MTDIILKQNIDKQQLSIFIRDLSSNLNVNLKHMIEDSIKNNSKNKTKHKLFQLLRCATSTQKENDGHRYSLIYLPSLAPGTALALNIKREPGHARWLLAIGATG